MTASERLREAIRMSGASLGSLARQSGCDPGNLSKFMGGKSGLGLDVGVQLAAVLGFDIRGHYPGCEASPMSETVEAKIGPKIRTLKSVAVDRIVMDDPVGSDAGPIDPIWHEAIEERVKSVPAKPARIVNAVPPPTKRAMSPAEVAKRKKLGMPID